PRDPIPERREGVAFARVPRPFDELDDADPVLAAQHAQGEAEGGRRFAFSRSGVDDQKSFFHRLPGDFRVLHGLAFRHLGAVPLGRTGIDGISHHFTFIGMPATSRTTRSATAAKRWLSRPAASRKRRASAFSGTMPRPTSLATRT